MIKIIKKRYLNFCQSPDNLKFKFFYNKFFKEKNIGKLGLNFSDKPSRSEIVQEIINKKNYKSYLEIGCFKDELFKNIICEKKIGVDPVSGGTIRKTSDDFFISNEEIFDIIFIDGLHIYNQVKKDIANSLNFLSDDGIILLHDCLPNTVYDQAIPRCKMNWNGDVWKAIVEVRTKKNVDSYTCYADQGIGVIFKRPNKNLLDLKINKFSKLKFKDYFFNYKNYMNLISFEELKKEI
ncbi:class I SAM-dependent methyltransferase [Candidatus Pelagibacter sp.]|nr:class I SAM-dependent methyltransferase [Candidatus Pelagibacter sp.]